MNTIVGGTGVNLHDLSPGGLFKRYMLISPGYAMHRIAQAAGRIYRDGTTSDAHVRIFYGKKVTTSTADPTIPVAPKVASNGADDQATEEEPPTDEMRLLEAIARKSAVNYEMLDHSVQANVKFPGDWECYHEP